MAEIAGKLGHLSDASDYRKKASDLAALVRSKMWSAQDQTFYNIDSRTGKHIKLDVWSNLTPLWVGPEFVNPKQAKQMIEKHVLNPQEFWSPSGIRSLSRGDHRYNPDTGYWRGPVWIISNYMIMQGLTQFGYDKQAQKLAVNTVNVLTADIKQGGGMNECYDPRTGNGVGSDHFVSWDILAEHMIDEAFKKTDSAAVGSPTGP